MISSIDLKNITLSARTLIEVNVSSLEGTKIVIDGVVRASHQISIGNNNVCGDGDGGLGMVHGLGIRANLGGWSQVGQGVLTGCKILQALVFPTDLATIIGRSTSVSDAVFSESSRVNADYAAFRAFEGRMFPTHTAGAAYQHYLQVELPAPVVVFRYRLWAAPLTSFVDAPIDWTLQGSSNGTTWNIVDTRVNSMPPSTAGAGRKFDTIVTLSIPHGEYIVKTPGLFKYYRLDVTKTGGGNPSRDTILKVSEMELIGR